MPGKIVLALGGCRSGKSAFALDYAEQEGGDRVFIATAAVLDPEMADRVRRHREERAGRGWRTCEEQLALARAIAGVGDGPAIVVDCLTVWLGNVFFQAEAAGRLPDEPEAIRLAGEIAAAAGRRRGTTVLVANEVGLGIVPENPMARRFRDLAGRTNQVIAAAAAEVHWLVAGIATRIK